MAPAADRSSAVIPALFVCVLLASARLIHAEGPVLIGETGVLKPLGEGATIVLVGVDEKAVDEMYKALLAQDEPGMEELAAAGRIFIVPPGTKVKVIDLHGFLAPVSEIRILEGANKNRRGFVSVTSVAKQSDQVRSDQGKSELPEIFGDQSGAEEEDSWLDSTPTPSASVAKREFFKVRINERFRLGDFSYKIRKIESCREVGVGVKSAHQSAPAGSQYVVVTYVVQNEGQQMQEGLAIDFSKVFELRSGDMPFPLDAVATTALATSNSLNARSLPSGASGTEVAVFKVPDRVAANRFQVIVSGKDIPKSAILALVPTHPSSAKAKSVRATARQSSRPRNSEYEEMRREILLNRPPGTSSTDYDPDWH